MHSFFNWFSILLTLNNLDPDNPKARANVITNTGIGF